MQYKMLSMLALAFGATQTLAYTHGEEGDHNGAPIRWQQLAEGVFTGVPADEWDDTIHKISSQKWDVDEILALADPSHNTTDVTSRDLILEARNLESSCQAVFECVKYGAQATLLAGVNTWITLANYGAGQAGRDLMNFLDRPFVASAAGVAIAGIISGQVNDATKTECSTSSSEADVISAAVNAALAQNPDAGDVTVQVNGPSGSWSITVNAAPAGQNPPASC